MMYRLSEIVDELNCLMKELVGKMDHQQAVYRINSIEYERFEDFDEAF